MRASCASLSVRLVACRVDLYADYSRRARRRTWIFISYVTLWNSKKTLLYIRVPRVAERRFRSGKQRAQWHAFHAFKTQPATTCSFYFFILPNSDMSTAVFAHVFLEGVCIAVAECTFLAMNNLFSSFSFRFFWPLIQEQ